MSSAVQWLVLVVRKVIAWSIPPLAEGVHSLLTVPSAENAHPQESNVANVPDAPIFSPHFTHFPLLFHKRSRDRTDQPMVWS